MRGVSIQGISISPNPVEAGKSFLISVKAESQANRFKFPMSILKAIGLIFKAPYTLLEKVGTRIFGLGTYDEWLNPTIEGKSEQTVAVQSANLCPSDWSKWTLSGGAFIDSEGYCVLPNMDSRASIQVRWDKAASYFQISLFADKPFRSGTGYIDSAGIALTGGNGWAGDGGIRMASTFGALLPTATTSATSISECTKIEFVVYRDAPYAPNPYKFRDVCIQKRFDRVPDYTPFIPNSPSPDYPSPIRSSENFDVVSCGRNLLDVYKWGNKNGVVPIDNVITQTFTSGGLHLNITKAQLKLKPNQTYSVIVRVLESDTTSTKNILAVYGYTVNNIEKFLSGASVLKGSTSIVRFTSPPDGSYAISFAGMNATFTLSLQIMILDGEYTAETLPPYESYHATTAHVTDPLRSIGDVHDTIEVSDGKVEVIRRVENRRLTTSDMGIFRPDSYKNITYFDILKTSDDINRGSLSAIIPLLCEFAQYSDYRPSGFDSNTQVEKICTGGNNFYVVGFPHGTTDEQGKAKLANTNYLYALKTPTRTDITTTPLGQAMLALRTYPHYTQVYTNATLPPTLRAKIKEMEL